MKIGMVIKHEIRIIPTKNMGFVVKIGCGTFCAPDVSSLVCCLRDYLEDPGKYGKAYSELDCGEPVQEARPVRGPTVDSGADTCEVAPSGRG